SKTGPLMFPELVPTDLEHPSAATMIEVREALKSWAKPTLVFFGDSDPIFPPQVAERFAARMPNAVCAPPVAGAGHFLQEDEGEEVGRRIASWLKAGAAAVGPRHGARGAAAARARAAGNPPTEHSRRLRGRERPRRSVLRHGLPRR